jgi:hypothetical protein
LEGERRLEKNTDDLSPLWRASQPKQNNLKLSLLHYDFWQVNRRKKFGKNSFHTLQGTMFHRPLTNTSSFKITAAYCTVCLQQARDWSSLAKPERKSTRIRKILVKT